MIEKLPPPAPGIIGITVSGKLWHEHLNNILPLMEAAGASQLKGRLLVVRLIPLSCICTIDEIGDAADFMARCRAGMITGQMPALNTKGAAA